MEKDNVYLLFEETNSIGTINGKLTQKTGATPGGRTEEVHLAYLWHIYRHSFDIKLSKAFSFLVGMEVECSLTLWGNIRLRQSNWQYADDALKFRAICSWSGYTPENIFWQSKFLDIYRDEMAIEWSRKKSDGYEYELKAVSNSLRQEKLKLQVKSESDWYGQC